MVTRNTEIASIPIILGEIYLLQNTKFHLELANVNRISLIGAQLVNK